MASKKESIWKQYPDLSEALVRFIAIDNILDGNKLKDLVNQEAKKLGIKEEISISSVQSKKGHLAKVNNDVKAIVKKEMQRELLEGKHAVKEAVLKGKWLSTIGIEGNEDFTKYIPKSTGPQNTYKINVANDDNPYILQINAPLVGSLVEPELNKDVFHNSLRWASRTNADGVLITGDLIYILTQKWGTKKPRKVNVVGVKPDPDIIKESYPKVVLEQKSIEDRISDKDVVFTTVKIRLDLVLKELARIFRDENGIPVYNGPVYVVTGELEEEIATHYASEIVRLIVGQERDQAQRQLDLLRLEKRQETDKQVIKKIDNEITEWEMYKKVFANMTNHDSSQVGEIAESMVGYLVKHIEEAVPNGRVIGRGDAFLEIGNKKVFVTRGKATTAYNGTSGGTIREKTYTHIKNNPGLNIPDVILVAGLNPYWTGLYASHFVPEIAGDLDDRRQCHIMQVPTALSANRYRRVLRNFAKVHTQIDKVAEVSDFESGATALKWSGDFFVPEALTSEFLTNDEVFSSKSNIDKVVNGKEKRSRIIYSNKQGCEHAGARFITQYPSLNDPNGLLVKTHFQVVYEAFIASNAPIHLWQSDGDTLHWANYAVHKEGYPDSRVSLNEHLERIVEISKNKSITKDQKQKLMAFVAFQHAVSEGVMQPDGQLEYYQYLLKPVKQFFFNVIKRAKRSGIVTVGPRFGKLTQGQGNHNENSFRHGHVNISEAKFVARAILAELLMGSPSDIHKELEESIVAAVFSDIGEARGMFGIPVDRDKEYTREQVLRMDKVDGYFYAVYMMHKQGSSKTKDNMRPMIQAFRNRLTEDQYEANRFSINLGGDDHTGGWALTRTALHIKSGCQMGGNSFGRKTSFPEQNIFSAVWGVPVGGPSWGPLRVITFDQRFARKYADKPFDINVEKLFPNPA